MIFFLPFVYLFFPFGSTFCHQGLFPQVSESDVTPSLKGVHDLAALPSYAWQSFR